MKILELCLSPDLGGLELYALRSARALQAGDDEVLTVCARQGRLHGKLAEEGLDHVPFRNGWRPFPLLAARRLAALIDRQGIEVIHLHWGKDLPLAVLAKRLSRRRPALVYTRQMQLTRAKRDPYHRFLYGSMDTMLTITEQLADAARRHLPAEDAAKVRCLYYGVAAPGEILAPEQRKQLRVEAGLPAEGFVVGLFGRMEPYKGQTLMLEALASARAAGETIHALLVGHEMEPGYRAKLQQKAEELGIAERVVFQGFVENPQRWMQLCDVLALTTIEETFGLVLVEAMRAGVAVLGSDRGGVPEIIRHGANGLLFRSGDAADLYAQLGRYYREPELRARLAAAGKADADQRFNEQTHFVELRRQLAEAAKSE
ncbi:MAG TPA: glycosyltransferase family 4 protein [Gammaproteobacteria bacterium]